MNELITVNEDAQTVSARDLHEALEVKERFSLWFGRFTDMFVDNEDFTSVGKPTVVNNGAERILEDYLISVEMAKHISMMSKTEKGKQCRQYFINLEKTLGESAGLNLVVKNERDNNIFGGQCPRPVHQR